MKNIVIAFFIGILLAGSAAFFQLQKERNSLNTVKIENNGYVKYKDYLSKGKEALSEKSNFIGANIEREDTFSREIKKKKGVFSSDATVAITYTGVYTFGFELPANSYEIESAGNSIQLILNGKPKLLVQPSFKNPSHSIPIKGWLINEAKAVVELYEGLPNKVLAEGKKMESEEAIIALCEKSLISFLQNFFSAQQGVTQVPKITIKYRS